MEALICANIPLYKADNPKMRAFFLKHVKNVGSIGESKALKNRIPPLYEAHRKKLVTRFTDQPVYVIVDEMTDDRAKMILNILLASPVKSDSIKIRPYLVDMLSMDRTNAATVGGAILRSLTLMGVQFEKGRGCDIGRRSVYDGLLAKRNSTCICK